MLFRRVYDRIHFHAYRDCCIYTVNGLVFLGRLIFFDAEVLYISYTNALNKN